MKLSVVVPCYNEGASLEQFHNSLSEVLQREKISYEIIMVDDGSFDDTIQKIIELNKKDKNVKGVSFSRNFGKESAMLAGLRYASGDYIAIMDADMQHSPCKLIEMYKKLLEDPNYDSICAYKSNRNDESGIKRTLTAIFYRFNNIISDVKLLPGASDFRVFKKDVKDAIIALPEKTRFLKGIFSWVGFNTIYVPYTPDKRMFGKTKWSLIKLLRYSLGGIVSFSTMILKLMGVISIPLFIVGLLNFILLGNLSHRTILLFISILILWLGIIAVYISRIYSNILGRPCYIIKKEIGFK